jgi:hypothetical protein
MLTDVNEIDQEVLAEVADFAIASGGNLMTFGPAGVGKTEIAMQATQLRNRKYVYLNLSVLEAPELLGLPMIDEIEMEVEGQKIKSRVATYAPPSYLPLYNPKVEPVVLLVDEIDKAKPELQNPMLELFQFRSMNGRKMNISSVIATGNLPDENAFSQPVSWALTNRCSVYKVIHAFDPWQEWAARTGINPLITGFLSRNQDYLLKPNASGDSTAYCNPSPRSWVSAARDLDHTDNRKHSVNFQTMIVGGRVGQGAAVKFKVWLEHYRFVEPFIDRLVKNGEHPSGEAVKDTARVIVCAIAGANALMQEMKKTPTDEAAKEKQTKEVGRISKNVCGWMQHLSSDICIAACKSVLTMKAIQEYKLTKIPEFMAVFVKVRQAMKDPDA